MSRARLTRFEFLVLAAILRIGDDAYGVAIAEEIRQRTGRDVAVGSLYRTLKRLEKKGCVSSTTGEPTPERGGRAKTFYRVEAAGREALRESVAEVRSLVDGLDLRWEAV